MKKILCSKKRGTLGMLAFLAFMVPSLVFGAVSPILDGANLYKVANPSISNAWSTSTQASPGQTINLMVHVHNGAVGSVATNVRAAATLPAGEVRSYVSTATVSADGLASVSQNVTINLTESARIEYIAGSTSLYNHLGQLEGSLPDGITTGGIKVLDQLNGCWEYEKWVIFKARIVSVPKKNPCICIENFHDVNGNGVRDAGEPTLTGWQFRVVGPGVDKVVVVGADGCAAITGIQAGTYTITEIQKEGWVNTTPLVKTLVVEDLENCVIFVYGNREKPPVCVGESCVVKPPTTLPTSGPAEMIGGILGAGLVSGGTLAYIRSKKNLKSAYRK